MTTAWATHLRYIEHFMPVRPHPERPERIDAVWRTLGDAGLISRMSAVDTQPVEEEWMRAVHSSSHIDILEWVAAQEKTVMIDGDTYALPVSYEIARLAAGAVTGAVDAVMSGTA